MDNESYADNINTLKQMAKKIKTIDLLDPSSRIVNIMTEILERCRNLPELEMVDFNNKKIEIDNIEADA